MAVYKGIAPGEERKALPSLDVNTRRVADGLLQLAFSLTQQVSDAPFLTNAVFELLKCLTEAYHEYKVRVKLK